MATKKKIATNTNKEPVRLRKKELANGNISLYLDIYRSGKREYEFLKLYLIAEKTPFDKEQNRQTLATAQAVKARRQVEIQNNEYGFLNQSKINTPFLLYYRAMCEEKKSGAKSGGNFGCWASCLRYLEGYCTEKTTFRDITTEWISGFKNYLDKGKCGKQAEEKSLSQNTKVVYFSKLAACINQAFKDGIMPINPLRNVVTPKLVETEKTHLSFDEVKKMEKIDCKNRVLKRAFLFSCLTGLRKGDIEKMTWDRVQKMGDQTRIIFKQKKTGGQEYLDINKQAEVYLGERQKGTERVFAGLAYNAHTLSELRRWALLSGVTKHIAFHTARHTFAVMMLDLGAEIYTVSKLLGHKDLSTTQVYAKVLDKKKQEAVNLIPDING